MPVTVGHVLSATTPDDPAYEIRPSHWNSDHAITLNLSGTDIIGAFSNDAAVNVSFSTNGAGYVIASANVTAAPSPVNITGDNGSSVNAQTLAFKNSNGLTLGVSTAANGASITGSYTVPTQTNQTVGGYFVGNTTGQSSSSTVDARSISVDGAGIVSAGWSNGTIRISATQSNQAFSADASSTFQTLSLQDSNGISFSNNAGAIRLTHALQFTSATSAITSNAMHSTSRPAFSADASSTFQTLTLQNSNGISFSNNAGAVRITHDLAFSSQTNNTGRIYVTAQSTGQSSSSTYDLRTLSIVPDGIISAGWSNGSFRISATVAAQTNQTLGIYASSNTTGASSSSTYDARSLTIVGSDNISVGWTNGSLAIKGAAGGAGGSQSVGMSTQTAGGATSGTTGYASGSAIQYLLVPGSNITMSQSVNGASGTMSIYAPSPGAAAEANWFTLAGDNTAGNTTASGSSLMLSVQGPLTISGTNNSQIKISAPATSSIIGSSGISISTNGSTITVGQVLGSYYHNFEEMWPNSTAIQPAQSTSHIQPFCLPEPISFDYIRIPMSAAVAASSTGVTTGNSQFSYGLSRTHRLVIYTRGVGASSLSLQSVFSTSLTDQQSINVSAAANSTQFSYTNRATYQMSTGTVGFTYDYSSSAASLNFHTSGMTAITGLKIMELSGGTTFSAGQYWLMYGASTSTASQYTAQGTRLLNNFSQYGMSQPNLAFGTIGAATNNSVGPFFGHGSFTTAGGGSTASLPISAVTTSGSHNKMFFQLVRIA